MIHTISNSRVVVHTISNSRVVVHTISNSRVVVGIYQGRSQDFRNGRGWGARITRARGMRAQMLERKSRPPNRVVHIIVIVVRIIKESATV